MWLEVLRPFPLLWPNLPPSNRCVQKLINGVQTEAARCGDHLNRRDQHVCEKDGGDVYVEKESLNIGVFRELGQLFNPFPCSFPLFFGPL